MIAILQKSFLWMLPGTVFNLKKHEEHSNIEMFVCEEAF